MQNHRQVLRSQEERDFMEEEAGRVAFKGVH